MEYIAFDSHKRYTFAVVTDESGRIRWEGSVSLNVSSTKQEV